MLPASQISTFQAVFNNKKIITSQFLLLFLASMVSFGSKKKTFQVHLFYTLVQENNLVMHSASTAATYSQINSANTISSYLREKQVISIHRGKILIFIEFKIYM